MPGWDRFFPVAATWLGRLYGLCFLAFGGLCLYWGATGLVTVARGVESPGRDLAYCAIAFITGALSLWAGSHLVRNANLAKEYAGVRGLGDALTREGDVEVANLAAALESLEADLPGDAAKRESRGADLRKRSSYDVDAALALRRILQKQLEINVLFRKDVLKNVPEVQQAPMLAEIDGADRRFRDELLELDKTIARLNLRARVD